MVRLEAWYDAVEHPGGAVNSYSLGDSGSVTMCDGEIIVIDTYSDGHSIWDPDDPESEPVYWTATETYYYHEGKPFYMLSRGSDGPDTSLELWFWDEHVIRRIEEDGVVHDTGNTSFDGYYRSGCSLYDGLAEGPKAKVGTYVNGSDQIIVHALIGYQSDVEVSLYFDGMDPIGPVTGWFYSPDFALFYTADTDFQLTFQDDAVSISGFYGTAYEPYSGMKSSTLDESGVARWRALTIHMR